MAVALHWTTRGWSNHPLARRLNKYHPQGWVRVAQGINVQYQQPDKVVSTLGNSTIVVLDTWLLQCNK